MDHKLTLWCTIILFNRDTDICPQCRYVFPCPVSILRASLQIQERNRQPLKDWLIGLKYNINFFIMPVIPFIFPNIMAGDTRPIELELSQHNTFVGGPSWLGQTNHLFIHFGNGSVRPHVCLMNPTHWYQATKTDWYFPRAPHIKIHFSLLCHVKMTFYDILSIFQEKHAVAWKHCYHNMR